MVSIFSLPRELRDIIYGLVSHYVLVSANTMFRPGSSLRTIASTLATSQQVRNEMKHYISESTTFRYTTLSALERSLDSRCFCDLLRSVRYVQLELDMMDYEHLLGLNCAEVRSLVDAQHAGGYGRSLKRSDAILPSPACKLLATLRHLDIVIPEAVFPSPYIEELWLLLEMEGFVRQQEQPTWVPWMKRLATIDGQV